MIKRWQPGSANGNTWEQREMDKRAIGVFDSGLGGLTAAEEFSRLLPGEDIIYLADSHNMPYGEKGRERILELSLRDLSFLLERGVKAVFIACGTATSNALEQLRSESPVPVFGVVEPGVREAISVTRNRKIGLLATRASVDAGKYQALMAELGPEMELTVTACPKFASMVEQGVFDKNDPRVREAVLEYLPPLKQAGVDTVILGCTHYPLLSDVIGEYMGEGVELVSAGGAAARELAGWLTEKDCLGSAKSGLTEYYTTGATEPFARTAQLMLKRDISDRLSGLEPFDKGE